MYSYVFICVALLNFTVSEAFFLWKDKSVFLCFKVCPLYCSKRERRDVDSAPWASEDWPAGHSSDWYPYPPEFWVEDFHHHHHHIVPYHIHPHGWTKPTHKPKPTTPEPTTTAAPTTTMEPTFICVVCEKKCGFPNTSQ